MALKDTDPNEEYPYIFMVEQSIFQSLIHHVSSNPRYAVSLVWRRYKVDESGNMVFHPGKPYSYYNPDFYLSAIMDAGSGDMTHATTLQAQELSIKRIIEGETGMTLEVV